MPGSPLSRGRTAGFAQKLQLLGARLVDLLVRRLGHLLEPFAVGGAADDISDLVVDPVERSNFLSAGISQGRLRQIGFRAIHGEALARRAFIHIESCSAGGTGKQPAAYELQSDRL